MSAESAIRAVLAADATLLALATGGVWDFEGTGSEGLNRTLTPSAWDSNGIIKPTILVSARNANPGYNIQDDDGQVMDTRQVVEVYLMQFQGYDVIASMKSRCYALLQAQQLAGTYRVDWAGDLRMGRDVEFDAVVERQDWLCIWVQSV